MDIPRRQVNLAHLDHLSTPIMVDGQRLLATKIYADPPSYAPIDAPGEGTACVDDVARAAIVYLDEHARTGSTHALGQARSALDFTLRMQRPDGLFANFITDDLGTINHTGATSRPVLGWWTFRGMWALARGYQAFASSDAAYAQRLLGAYQRTEGALATALAADGGAGSRRRSRGHDVPTWLDRIPSDQASIAVLALAHMQEARPDARTSSLLSTLAEGIRDVRVRRGSGGVFDHAAHTASNPEMWHAWGAQQGEALARAGRVLGRADLVEAARAEVEGLLAWQLAAGRVHELTPAPLREGQQAYGVTAAVRASMALHAATGDDRYARMAGLHASWFLGNNMAGAPMYDASTGRAYDGIDGAGRGINYASGAESTIEGLLALQAIEGVPEAERYARLLPTEPGTTWTNLPAAMLRGDDGTAPTLLTRPASTATNAPAVTLAELAPGTRVATSIDVAADGTFMLLAGRMRDATTEGGTTLDVLVDGTRIASLAPRADAGDGPHVALDRLDGAPVRLAAGRHELTITARGSDGAGPALLQSLVLHPSTAHQRLRGPDGLMVELGFAPDDGHLKIDEHPG